MATLEPDFVSDRQLLARFSGARDQQAFAELVRRHGGMVQGVCRRVLRSAVDADDAFQATFLVLARRARANRWQESIAGWLYQTAYRTALKARQTLSRRTQREQSAADEVANCTRVEARPSLADLTDALDEELLKLPDELRQPLVLCSLEGYSRGEAAEHLGVSLGAIKDRLERAKEMLRGRLTRRGITFSAVSLAAFLGAGSAQAAASSAAPVIEISTAFAAGQVAAGTVPASVFTLTEGVLQMMLWEKVRWIGAAAASLVCCAVAFGVLTDTPDRFEKGIRGRVLQIAADKQPATISVQLDEFETPLTLDVAPDAKVSVAFAGGKVQDIAKGSYVSLRLGSDHRTVREIYAAGRTQAVVIKSPLGDTWTVEFGEGDEEEEPGPQQTVTLAGDAVLRIGGITAPRTHFAPEMRAVIEFAADGKTVNGVEAVIADERLIDGELLAFDADKKAVQIKREVNDAEVEVWMPLAADAVVRLDGKPSNFAALKPGVGFTARLSADQLVIEAVHATTAPPDEDGDQDEAATEKEENKE